MLGGGGGEAQAGLKAWGGGLRNQGGQPQAQEGPHTDSLSMGAPKGGLQSVPLSTQHRGVPSPFIQGPGLPAVRSEGKEGRSGE